MLQQTQVDRVIDKYNEFIGRFPDVRALADAAVADVLTAWSGLGYNRRALLIRRCTQTIVVDHGGRVPDDPAVLVTLPGIGKATAASIAAFGFNRPTVFIETNIRTVFIHEFFPTRNDVDDAELLPLVAQTLDTREPCRWYSALMDYGTVLKREHPNPSRKSAHHTRQSAFEGSDRQVRGAVLRALMKQNSAGIAALGQTLTVEPARMRRIVAQMIAEGFIEKTRNGVSLYNKGITNEHSE
jgi:A/G-specific adenine glycosylase